MADNEDICGWDVHAQKDSPKTENVHLLGDKTEKQELNSNLQRMNEIEWKTLNGELLV